MSVRTIAAFIVFATMTQTISADVFRAFIGTYTSGGSKGIYVSDLDTDTGKLSAPRLAAELTNPSFVAVHPNHEFLYAVGEVGEFKGKKAGGVTAFKINDDGTLTQINQQSSGGGGPCHLVVDHSGSAVLVANYGGGSVASLPVSADGSLGEAASFIQHEGSSVNERRQAGPHAHSINVDPANKFAFAADLGLDKVLVYRLDSKSAKLTPNDPPSTSVAPGSGPRHFAFHPNGRFAWVINEMVLTVTGFAYNADKGTLTEIQTLSTLPKGEGPGPGLSTAEVQVHPSGKFLYGSNRGHNTIVAYRINQDTGKLTYIENESTQGETPRNFAIDPSGKFLLAENQQSGTVHVLRINQDTGALDPTGNSIEVPRPVCIKMIPLSK